MSRGRTGTSVSTAKYLRRLRTVARYFARVRGDNSVVPPDKFIHVPARQIRKDNLDAFWTDLKQKVGSTETATKPAAPATKP